MAKTISRYHALAQGLVYKYKFRNPHAPVSERVLAPHACWTPHNIRSLVFTRSGVLVYTYARSFQTASSQLVYPSYVDYSKFNSYPTFIGTKDVRSEHPDCANPSKDDMRDDLFSVVHDLGSSVSANMSNIESIFVVLGGENGLILPSTITRVEDALKYLGIEALQAKVEGNTLFGDITVCAIAGEGLTLNAELPNSLQQIVATAVKNHARKYYTEYFTGLTKVDLVRVKDKNGVITDWARPTAMKPANATFDCSETSALQKLERIVHIDVAIRQANVPLKLLGSYKLKGGERGNMMHYDTGNYPVDVDLREFYMENLSKAEMALSLAKVTAQARLAKQKMDAVRDASLKSRAERAEALGALSLELLRTIDLLGESGNLVIQDLFAHTYSVLKSPKTESASVAKRQVLKYAGSLWRTEVADSANFENIPLKDIEFLVHTFASKYPANISGIIDPPSYATDLKLKEVFLKLKPCYADVWSDDAAETAAKTRKMIIQELGACVVSFICYILELGIIFRSSGNRKYSLNQSFVSLSGGAIQSYSCSNIPISSVALTGVLQAFQKLTDVKVPESKFDIPTAASIIENLGYFKQSEMKSTDLSVLQAHLDFLTALVKVIGGDI